MFLGLRGDDPHLLEFRSLFYPNTYDLNLNNELILNEVINFLS